METSSSNANADCVVEVRSLAFTRRSGGTGLTDWDHDPRLEGPIKVRIVKGWFDYETGYRFVARADDERLRTYLDQHAKSADAEVYVSQFDFVGDTSGVRAIEILNRLTG